MRRTCRWIALVLACLLPACATNPVTGERELMLVSESQEIAIGRDNDEQIVEYYGLYDDPELAAWVDRIGQRMAAASERPDLPWTFRIVDDTAVNAFALPGGFVYLTRGILSYMTTEAEVVGVLGHEIGHVTARHSAQQITKAQVAQIGLGVGSILSEEVRAAGGLLQTGVGLLFLKFSRDDERQADELGVRYAADAGYDPRGLARFFEIIDRLSERQGGRLPTWLSTHPDPENRGQRVIEMSEPLIAGRDLTVGREDHLQRLDGIVFGPDPREGVMVGNTFKHPALLFQMDFPEAWSVQNGKTAVVAAPERGNVVVGLTLAGSGGRSLRDVAAAVLRERGVQQPDLDDVEIHGRRAVRADYLFEVEGGTLHVLEVFLEHGGNVYDLIGYTPAREFTRWDDTIWAWQRSFRALPRSEADDYAPDRLRIFRTGEAAPLSRLLEPSPAADMDTLALINGLQPDARVDPRTLLKRVTVGYTRR